MRNKFIIKEFAFFAFLLFFASSCTKEYITNEYITNEYYETIYNSDYYYVYLSEQKEITTNIRPPYLQAGDTVAIIATSNQVKDNKSGIETTKNYLES